MLVSHRKHFIYTKTVKTAGTSVESYFEQYCMSEGEWEFTHAREQYVSGAGIIGYRGADGSGREWFNHMPAIDIKNKVGKEVWDNYFKFCVIRNPFDKLVSYFFFLEKQGNPHSEADETTIARFRKWIAKGVDAIDRDKYLIDGEVCVDYFIRFEELENGIQQVCDRLNVVFEPEKIPKLKAGVRDGSISLSDFYDAETARAVSSAYQLEMNLFGYDSPV
jgi:hypothetical protein